MMMSKADVGHNEKILLALSGGMGSTAVAVMLSYVLSPSFPRRQRYQVVALHIDDADLLPFANENEVRTFCLMESQEKEKRAGRRTQRESGWYPLFGRGGEHSWGHPL